MSRSHRLLFTLTAATLAVSPAVAVIPTQSFTIGIPDNKSWDTGHLNVTDGKLTLGKRPSDESPRPSGPGCWDVSGERTEGGKIYRISSPSAKKYLAYDPTGADPRVFLVDKPSEGTAWKLGTVRPPGESLRKSAPDQPPADDNQTSPLRVPAGKFEGWYLTVEEKEEKVDGETVVVRRFLLAKEPKGALVITRLCEHR